MLITDELELMEKLTFVEPCERVRLQFEAHGSGRTLNLSSLKAEKGHCVWCDKKLTGQKRRWCSKDCVTAAMWRAHPQSPAAKVYRLIHDQNFACKGCGLSFEEEIRKDILKRHAHVNRIMKPHETIYGLYGRKEGDPEVKVTYWWLGDGTGFQYQTDHIVPVHAGGKGIDPKNLQVLCVPCHTEKTKKDRKIYGKSC